VDAGRSGYLAVLEFSAFGGQVLGAQLPGWSTDLFYCPPVRMRKEGHPIRGGIPILFPQFAKDGSTTQGSNASTRLPKHGFARQVFWRSTLSHPQQDAAINCSAVRHCVDARWVGYGHAYDWPYRCELSVKAELYDTAFEHTLTVRNLDCREFSYTGGIHPYWRVFDISRVLVEFSGSMRVVNRLTGERRLLMPREPLKISEQGCELLLTAASGSDNMAWLSDGAFRLKLNVSGYCDWVLWSPGEAGAQALTDLPRGGWREFVCLEPVCLSTPQHLCPGEERMYVLRCTYHRAGTIAAGCIADGESLVR
jgi:glucose-6-phosphate 1-epimerase